MSCLVMIRRARPGRTTAKRPGTPPLGNSLPRLPQCQVRTVRDDGEARTGYGAGSSTPGFMMPAGSSAALAPFSAAAKTSERWRAYQGMWSRPTA